MPSQISDPNKREEIQKANLFSGVPNTLTHRSPDLADDWGESQFWTVWGNAVWCISASLPTTTSHVRKSQCHYVIASQPPCHLHGSLVSYITLLPPYSHCVSTLPYHSINKSHSPCISVATSHCHHVTCHHCLSGVLQVRLTAAETKLREVSSTLSDSSQTPIQRRMPPDPGTGQVFILAIGALGLLL